MSPFFWCFLKICSTSLNLLFGQGAADPQRDKASWNQGTHHQACRNSHQKKGCDFASSWAIWANCISVNSFIFLLSIPWIFWKKKMHIYAYVICRISKSPLALNKSVKTSRKLWKSNSDLSFVCNQVCVCVCGFYGQHPSLWPLTAGSWSSCPPVRLGRHRESIPRPLAWRARDLPLDHTGPPLFATRFFFRKLLPSNLGFSAWPWRFLTVKLQDSNFGESILHTMRNGKSGVEKKTQRLQHRKHFACPYLQMLFSEIWDVLLPTLPSGNADLNFTMHIKDQKDPKDQKIQKIKSLTPETANKFGPGALDCLRKKSFRDASDGQRTHFT